MAEQTIFEVKTIVSRPNQPDAVVNREYTSASHSSTDGAAREISEGMERALGDRLVPVNDGH